MAVHKIVTELHVGSKKQNYDGMFPPFSRVIIRYILIILFIGESELLGLHQVGF